MPVITTQTGDTTPPVITLPSYNHHYVNPTSLATSDPGHQGYDPNLLPDIMVASVGVTPGWKYNHDSSGWSDFAFWPNAVYDFVLSVDGDYEDANGKIAPTCIIKNSIATNLQFDTANAVRQWDYRTFQYWSYYPAGVSTVQCTLTDQAGNTGTLDFTFTVSDPSADTTRVDMASGSSTPGCEPNCFLPATSAVNPGQEIIFYK